MTRGQIFPLADKALDGTLEERLRQAREAGESFDQISRTLYTEGIPVSGETVRQWCHDLDIAEAS